MTAIRIRKNATLRRPTLNEDGQMVVPASGTAVKVAFWKRKLQQVVGPTGEVNAVTAIGFLKAGTDVERRDQLTVNGAVYAVMEVVPAEDDLGREDHIGVQLQGLV